MACSIINTHIRSPGLCNVAIKFIFCAFDLLRKDAVKEHTGLLACLFTPILEGAIAISHRLVYGRSLYQKLLKFSEVRLENSKLGRLDSIRDLLGSDGLRINHSLLFADP